MSVISLRKALGSHLCTVSLYRAPDGKIVAVLDDMPVHVIEGESAITARFFKAATWCSSAALDLMRQGLRFDEENRAAITKATPEDRS